MRLYCFLLLLSSFIIIVENKPGDRPTVSGVRLENLINTPGFSGYSTAGELLVQPDVVVEVVIFGNGLEDVEYISFTDSVCLTSEFNISNEQFYIHKDMRIIFKHSFLEWPTPWRICLKSESFGWIQIDDDRTWIQTVRPSHETYFPKWFQIPLMTLLFFLSALCSGLNLGLMSLSSQELKILMKCGSSIEAKYAAAILPVRLKGNQLLSTVIIVNVIVNAAITLLFDDLTEGFIAFISSSAGIVIFGEIVPQSLCVKYGLAIGAKTIWLTKFFMLITSPVTWPLGKILDKYAGEDIDTVDRERIIEMLKMNIEKGESDMDMATMQITIGAMELRKKIVKNVMTPIDNAFMLPDDTILNSETMTKICESGFSRIPVYEDNNRNKVISLLYVSDLALLGRDNNMTVRTVAGFKKRKLRIVDENMPLIDLMEEFKKGDYHLAMVAKPAKSSTNENKNSGGFIEKTIDSFIVSSLKVVEATAEIFQPTDLNCETEEINLVGLITLEDITEELLQSEITDETDLDDNLDEAQRKTRDLISKKRLAQLVCAEKKSERLSFHMLEMAKKWLLDKSLIFHPSLMDPIAFEKLIQRNIREVNIVQTNNNSSSSPVLLYQKEVSSNCFMLLLEGKAKIIFKKNLEFDVGPWTFFGEQILVAVEKSAAENTEPCSSFHFKPDYDLIVHHNCRYLQISLPALLHSFRITQFVNVLRSPKNSISDDLEGKNNPSRKTSRKKNNSLCSSGRTRASTSIVNNIINPAHLVAKISSVDDGMDK